MSIRPFAPADQSAVNALHRSVWWSERSPAGWRWLDANPARAEIDAPSGWVIENEAGEAAAFAGNLIQRFWLGDVRHHGATGFSIIVPPAVRGSSRKIIQAFLRQPGLFAHYTFNANSRSAPLYARHGMKAWPPRTHATKLAWIVDPLACLHSRFLRSVVKRAPHLTDPYRERFLSARLGGARLPTLPRGVSVMTDLSDDTDYAAFWTALKAEGRIVADRSPEILRWRIADPDQTLPPLMLVFRSEGRVTGFAMGLLAKNTPIDPVCVEILDLVALEGDDAAIPALMGGLMAWAKGQGAAKVRLNVVHETLLARLGVWATKARTEGGWGHCHAAFTPDGPGEATWAPTPFDADYAVCQRPVPLTLVEGRAPAAAARVRSKASATG